MVRVVKVGQGDCSVIRCPSGQVIVMDGGSSNSGETGGDLGDPVADRIYGAIASWARPTARDEPPTVHALVLSHPDKDHYNKILAAFCPQRIAVDDVYFATGGVVRAEGSPLQHYGGGIPGSLCEVASSGDLADRLNEVTLREGERECKVWIGPRADTRYSEHVLYVPSTGDARSTEPREKAPPGPPTVESAPPQRVSRRRAAQESREPAVLTKHPAATWERCAGACFLTVASGQTSALASWRVAIIAGNVEGDTNSRSLVLMLQIGHDPDPDSIRSKRERSTVRSSFGSRAILHADADEATEAFLTSPSQLRLVQGATIVTAAHHGSNTGCSTDDYVARVKSVPGLQAVYVSAGGPIATTYKLPRWETLHRWASHGGSLSPSAVHGLGAWPGNGAYFTDLNYAFPIYATGNLPEGHEWWEFCLPPDTHQKPDPELKANDDSD